MDYVKKKRLDYGAKRRRRHGGGQSVQETSRAGLPWGSDEDRLIGQYDILDDAAVGRLVFKLNRLPSEIRTRHVYVLKQRNTARRVAERLKNRPKSKGS